jgi:hypothetical protein
MTSPLPKSNRRTIAAFFIAPLVASAAFASGFQVNLPSEFSVSRSFVLNDLTVFGWLPVFLGASLLVAYPSTVIVGLPTFFFLRTKVALSVINCILAGVFVASAPWIAWLLVRDPHYWSDGPDLIYHMMGHYTVLGWIEIGKAALYYLAFLAPLGALAGLTFWLVAAAGAHKSVSASG